MPDRRRSAGKNERGRALGFGGGRRKRYVPKSAAAVRERLSYRENGFPPKFIGRPWRPVVFVRVEKYIRQGVYQRFCIRGQRVSEHTRCCLGSGGVFSRDWKILGFSVTVTVYSINFLKAYGFGSVFI